MEPIIITHLAALFKIIIKERLIHVGKVIMFYQIIGARIQANATGVPARWQDNVAADGPAIGNPGVVAHPIVAPAYQINHGVAIVENRVADDLGSHPVIDHDAALCSVVDQVVPHNIALPVHRDTRATIANLQILNDMVSAAEQHHTSAEQMELGGRIAVPGHHISIISAAAPAGVRKCAQVIGQCVGPLQQVIVN